MEERMKCKKISFIFVSKTDSKSSQTTDASTNFDEEPYQVNYLHCLAQKSPNQSKDNQAVNELASKDLNMTVNLIPVTWGTYFEQISVERASLS